MENVQGVFIDPPMAVLTQVGFFVGNLFLVILILIAGWLISKLIIKLGVIKIAKFLKIDEISKRIELDALLAKGGLSCSLSDCLGNICYWIAILVTFVIALNAVGLTIAADLLQRITLFVPNIIVAIFILILGMFTAVVVKNIVKSTATNAGISQANFLSKITEVVIMVFAIAMALEQVQIGARVVELTVSIILASFGLGFALAFGLGCKDIVGKSVAEFLEKIKK
ncbi:MAG: hypothetical protein WCX16_05365 [Candidatus Omnitrophota bacterium]